MLAALALVAGSLPQTAALAEGPACRIPPQLPSARFEPAPPGARRTLPVAGYLLALSWSPEYCAGRGDRPRDRLQCSGSAGRFGFILHGLWPEGEGRAWPQYCAAAQPLPPVLLRRHFCATPSVDLLQHQWAKHGVCMTRDPARYLAAGERLFRLVRYPDMAGFADRRSTVAQFTRAIARANPGIPESAIRVQRSPRGWLQEVRICLNRGFRPRACPAHVTGAGTGETLRVRRLR